MYKVIKRLFDICASGIALIVLLPVWIVAIVGIELSDPGPVFYMAKRVGKDNRVFLMFKFRSMRVDKNAEEKSVRPDTTRIFPWGRVLRRTKIDELPQLINVLIGDMAVIGPRPAAYDQMGITRSGMNAIVSSVTPGLSSPSALYDYLFGDLFDSEYEYNVQVLPTRLTLDLVYLESRSLPYDLKIIWYTIRSVFLSFFNRRDKRVLDELVNASRAMNASNNKSDDVNKIEESI